MKKLTKLIKPGLLVIFVYFYIDVVYIIIFNIKFMDLLFWWTANFTLLEFFYVAIPICVGGFIVVVFSITLNEQYIGLVGRKVELVYLGDKMPFIEVYYNPNDKKGREIEYMEVNKSIPNLSLRSVLKRVLFLQDPIHGRSSIHALGSIKPQAIKFLTGLSILLGFIGLLLLVVFTKPYIDANDADYPMYSGLELSKLVTVVFTQPETWAVIGWSILASIGIASLGLYRFSKLEIKKQELESSQPLQLPKQYYAGQTLTSEVIGIEPDLEESDGSIFLFHNNTSNIDGRFVTIKLLQYLEHPAYVSFYFNKNDKGSWEEKLNKLKYKEQPLLVDLDDAYRVVPAVALGL